ncbi:MAG: hypothetical protein QF464_06085, partial [Myxococcota bacterium]|nr:hypothetical protein [Myxococcota bacterium]
MLFQHTPHTHRLATMLLAIALAFAGSACDGTESGSRDIETGTVQMALTAVGTDGDTYRLRKATLQVDGPTSATVELDEAYGDSPVFRAVVDTGQYTITLEEGWVLQRYNGESFETVEAELLTENPAKTMVERNATTIVNLVFETIDD